MNSAIEMIYGAGWLTQNSRELENYFWQFREITEKDGSVLFANPAKSSLEWSYRDLVPYLAPFGSSRIICTGVRPLRQEPTIRGEYGTDYPKIPTDWRDAGSFRRPIWEDIAYLSPSDSVTGEVRVILTKSVDTFPATPRIILRRPTLFELFGQDKVELPYGFDWTGEFRIPTDEDWWCPIAQTDGRYSLRSGAYSDARLILKITERTTRQFLAEEKERLPLRGDWYFSKYSLSWENAEYDFTANRRLCAKLVETPSKKPYVLTENEFANRLAEQDK